MNFIRVLKSGHLHSNIVRFLFLFLFTGSFLGGKVHAYSSSIEDFDKAPGASIKTVEQNMRKPGVVDWKELSKYSNDETRNGQKRFRALRLSLQLQQMSSSEQHQQILNQFAREKNSDFKYSVVGDMATWPKQDAASFLRRIVSDSHSDPCLGLVAGSSLAHMQISDGKSAALEAILKKQICVDFAMMTLANLGATDLIPILESNPEAAADPEVRDNCNFAIFRINLHGKPISEQEKMLQEAFNHSDSGQLRQWAVLYLANIGDRNTFEFLVASANGGNDLSQREWALRALQLGVEKGYWSEQEVSARVVPRE